MVLVLGCLGLWLGEEGGEVKELELESSASELRLSALIVSCYCKNL